ncbi:MAG TPA: DMT family transporter [Nocardioides sp.]|nr:DMT family transporter [Nocardioides sp.]
MTAVADDARTDHARPAAIGGVPLALLSAVSFSLAGALARPLFDAGWSPGAVVLVRMSLGALAVLPFALRSLARRWHLLRAGLPTLVVYGVLAVAGAQFCYFSAVQHMQVGPALMIEYTSPAAVVGWLWWRHGQRPGRLTVAGALVAALGLLLVLDLFSGADLSSVGVAWAMAAMVGGAAHFVVSADDRSGLPPMVLAGGGLVVGTVVLGTLALVGALPMTASTSSMAYAGVRVTWWVPLLALGLVTSAMAYATGIGAARALGSRLASFVALSEVVAAVLWAWALLGELPSLVQLAGGALILVGVVGVKLGEPALADISPEIPEIGPEVSAGPAA